ncbi:hypothetical protein KKG51_04695, partial [Patescibacteria group bacterium]|nr:hypothetical protein [Patescibacteria group bacterium]
ASNTEYYPSLKEDERESEGMWTRIDLNVPDDKHSLILDAIRCFKGPREKFNQRIKRLLQG